MRHDDPLPIFRQMTRAEVREAVERAHQLRTEAIHDFASGLYGRLRSVFPRRPKAVSTATGSARSASNAPGWCVARNHGAVGSRTAGVTS